MSRDGLQHLRMSWLVCCRSSDHTVGLYCSIKSEELLVLAIFLLLFWSESEFYSVYL